MTVWSWAIDGIAGLVGLAALSAVAAAFLLLAASGDGVSRLRLGDSERGLRRLIASFGAALLEPLFWLAKRSPQAPLAFLGVLSGLALALVGVAAGLIALEACVVFPGWVKIGLQAAAGASLIYASLLAVLIAKTIGLLRE